MPKPRKIYHITHVGNIAGIASAGVLWSDAQRLRQGLACEVVGMTTIKRRRLEQLGVSCHPGTRVGEYVPFYFCPRSVMLYILHMGNHPELTYRGGQGPIVHLVADLDAVVAWAEAEERRWAFSDRNAGASYARFYARRDQLDRINWSAVEAHDWRSAEIKDGKQAELLVFDSFPWTLVEQIGTQSPAIAAQLEAALASAHHRPRISVERSWYY